MRSDMPSVQLHDELAPNPPPESLFPADDDIYPGGGRMNAQDVHQMAQSVEPSLKMAADGMKGEKVWADMKSKLHTQRMNNLAGSYSVSGEKYHPHLPWLSELSDHNFVRVK